MKTITDLFELIATETRLNEGKLLQFTFYIDTHYNWVTMRSGADIEGHELKEIFAMEKIDTPARLQQVYWTIYNNGRSRKQV